MIIHVKFITIVGRAVSGYTPTDLIERYLYGRTKIEHIETRDDRFVARLRTEGASDHAAAFEARCQADRFSSGLIGAKVFDTPAEADEHMQDMGQLFVFT